MKLRGKKILLGITGSIAAYKSILLTRLLVKAGAEVKVIMTPSAKSFVSPLVLSTFSNHEVLVDIDDGSMWANHVLLGRWADILLIAPLTCNTLGKMANGQCDNLLLAVYLSATCPVWVCPAMDEDMWHHPTIQRNIRQLGVDGLRVLPVGHGALASGLTGDGRMAEPEYIISALELFFIEKSNGILKNKKALVTAGPTYEAIDPVRFIGNHSSGKMGIALAEALRNDGVHTTLVLGPSPLEVPFGIEVIRVVSAEDMFEATKSRIALMDIAIFSAAVADFKPSATLAQKWKKDANTSLPKLELTENPDILKYCGQNKLAHQIIVGFALETEHGLDSAYKKLQNKNADFMVLNSLQDDGAGFGKDTNKVTVISSNGLLKELPLLSKMDTAIEIIEILKSKA